MRLNAVHAVAALSAAMLLSACSNAPQNASVGLPATGAAGENHAGPAPAMHHAFLGPVRTLYVDDYSIGSGVVDGFRYHTWAYLGRLTNGIDGPAGNWVDKNGNLYVANFLGADVTEYDPSGNLLFTYKNGLSTPFDVTTDQGGVVYVADDSGAILEDRQQIDSPLISCNTGSENNTWIAQNKSGDLFASRQGTEIIEYRHGLLGSNCAYKVLPIQFRQTAGIAIDTNNNLVVCDLGGGGQRRL